MKRKAATAESSCSRGGRGKGSAVLDELKLIGVEPPPVGGSAGGPTESIIMWPARRPMATRPSGTRGSPVSIER
eukprot:scaffold122982_cov22-Tisochrysis_lutea.AAC.4